MVSFIKSVTFDCADPLRVATFWAEALGSNVDEDSTEDKAWVEPAGWGGPSMWFQRVPEGKVAKNRVHLDVRFATELSGDERMAALEVECERLVALGATRVRRFEPEPPMSKGYVVMQDPEGNEFCLD